MAVVAIVEMKGDTKELLAKYDKATAAIMARGVPAPGLLVHTCVELDNGIRIANVWESREQAEAGFKDEGFQSALRSAGIEPTEPTIHQAHNHLNFAAMQGAAAR